MVMGMYDRQFEYQLEYEMWLAIGTDPCSQSLRDGKFL